MLYIASDHRGYQLKEKIKKWLNELGLAHKDLGNYDYDENDDYPDFGKLAAEKITENPEENRAILICGSGVGMDIIANRYKGVRSVLAWSKEVARSSRRDDNTNVLSLGADYLEDSQAEEIVEIWLKTEFSNEEKYLRRIQKIDA
jgi:ribose 5-phosphate isomerase B